MVKKRGIVWNYFTKKIHGSQITAFCKFCDASYIQNATRMEKHIERCVKCPDDVKRDFMNALSRKRAQSMLSIKLAESLSNQRQSVQNSIYDESLRNLKEWENRTNTRNNNQIPDEINHIDIQDSKNWHKDLQIESTESIEITGNANWEPVENNIVDENFTADNTQELEEEEEQEEQEEVQQPRVPRRVHSTRRFSQRPLHSNFPAKTSSLQNRIQQEQYLEKRALRRIAELELQRKTVEMEKFQWQYQTEKAHSEVRWAHECRMMQLKEEHQRQLIEQNRSTTIAMQANHIM